MSIAERDRAGVQVIRRAAQILDALKDAPTGLSLSQVAARTGLARSTVHRLLGALELESFVVALSSGGRYRLGPAISALAAAGQRDYFLDFYPVMTRVSREVKETVDLAVLEHDHVRFAHQIAAMHRLRAVSSVGAMFPAHCTANGKALLAELPDDQIRRLLPERLDQLTPNTISDREDLILSLETIRETGIALDLEEHPLGIAAVGVALSDSEGHTVAITVPMPAQRFYGNEEATAKALLSAKREFQRAQRRAVSA